MNDDTDIAKLRPANLRQAVVPAVIPSSESYRTYFGRSLDMNRIEASLRAAEVGLMTDLTDLEAEAIGLDPGLSALLAKRFGSIASLPWDVVAAQGEGIDRGLADEAADMHRQHLDAIPHLEEQLYLLAWALFHGRGALETHWEVQAGKHPWRPASLSWIHPRRLSFGPERELRLVDAWLQYANFTDTAGFALRDFPGKFITWTPQLFAEYPEREGLGPRCMYWAFFKRFSWRFRMVLTEIFGLPWRIVETDKEGPTGKAARDSAYDQAERLGGETTAVLAPGQKLRVEAPHPESSTLFGMTNDDVDKQMAKLILGNTGTTDNDETNRANGIIGKGEQDLVLAKDGRGLMGRIQYCLTRPWFALNFGADKLNHCPTFALRTEPQRDATAELERVSKVISFGVPVAVAEIREVTGYREPVEGEPYIVAQSPGVDPATGQPLPGVPMLVDPKGGEDEQALAAPTDDKPAKLPAAPDDLEAEGDDGAAKRAEQDLVAATRKGVALDFDDCVAQQKQDGRDQAEAEAICNEAQKRVEGQAEPSEALSRDQAAAVQAVLDMVRGGGPGAAPFRF